ncbi:MAG: flagellar protein FlgN [Clostridiales bacterium]|jgi:flagellar biosynthesis/type III secretory pathway chaperone|nr:flagellar protein FlgN [Clostridiales bacterium]
MQNALDNMITLLSEQNRIQKELLGLSYEKRRAVLNNQTDLINRVVQKEFMFLTAAQALEKKREQALSVLSKHFGIPESEITVTVIIERTSGELQRKFTAVQKELSAVIKTQAELNRLNQDLLKTQLEYTDMMLNLLVGPEDPLNNFYDDNGKMSEQTPRKKAGLIDRQV